MYSSSFKLYYSTKLDCENGRYVWCGNTHKFRLWHIIIENWTQTEFKDLSNVLFTFLSIKYSITAWYIYYMKCVYSIQLLSVKSLILISLDPTYTVHGPGSTRSWNQALGKLVVVKHFNRAHVRVFGFTHKF